GEAACARMCRSLHSCRASVIQSWGRSYMAGLVEDDIDDRSEDADLRYRRCSRPLARRHARDGRVCSQSRASIVSRLRICTGRGAELRLYPDRVAEELAKLRTVGQLASRRIQAKGDAGHHRVRVHALDHVLLDDDAAV